MGARFIVSPGLDMDVVQWCIEHDIVIIPGCITPSEIMTAMKLGLKVVKFFPANIYGGLQAMKALSGPFAGIKFVPTGGINAQNVGEYIAAPFIHTVGGSWICPRADIAAGNFEKITALCAGSRQSLLGYEVAHIGINAGSSCTVQTAADTFGSAFDFVSNTAEVANNQDPSKQGHLVVRTNRLSIAIADLKKKGFQVDIATARYTGEQMAEVCLKDEIGGFSIHLLQR